MLIRFMGPGCVRRIVDGVEFSREVGMVQEVSEELGATLVMTEEFDYAELHGDEGTGEIGFDEWVEEVADALDGEDAEGDWFLSEDPETVADEAEEADHDEVSGGLTKRG